MARAVREGSSARTTGSGQAGASGVLSALTVSLITGAISGAATTWSARCPRAQLFVLAGESHPVDTTPTVAAPTVSTTPAVTAIRRRGRRMLGDSAA
jgi:hypothetical protein